MQLRLLKSTEVIFICSSCFAYSTFTCSSFAFICNRMQKIKWYSLTYIQNHLININWQSNSHLYIFFIINLYFLRTIYLFITPTTPDKFLYRSKVNCNWSKLYRKWYSTSRRLIIFLSLNFWRKKHFLNLNSI